MSRAKPARIAKLIVIGATATLFCAAGAHAADPAALLEGHLKQAARIARGPRDLPTGDESAKAEIEERAKRWSMRLDSAAKEEDLLAAIPVSVREEARSIAKDQNRVIDALSKPSLPLALALAAERNPSVKTAYAGWRASIQRFEQAAYLEDLLGRYRAFTREIDTRVGTQIQREPLSKTYPFPSSLALKGEIIHDDVEIARLEYTEALRKAVNEVGKAYLDIQYAEEAASIIQDTRDLFAAMEVNARALFEAGTASQADSLRAQTELAMIENQVRTIEHERLLAVAHANSLLDLPIEAKWGDVQDVELNGGSLNIDALLEATRNKNQSVLTAQSLAKRAGETVRLAETMVYPRGPSAMSQLSLSEGAEAGPAREAMASFPQEMRADMPTNMFASNAAYIDELRARQQQAREALGQAIAEAFFATRHSYHQVEISRLEYRTYTDSVVPKARQAFETIRERYNTASAPFTDYLDSGRRYLESLLRREQARREMRKMLVELQDAIGLTAADLLRDEGDSHEHAR